MTMIRPEDSLLNKLVSFAVIGLLSWNVWTTQQLSVSVAVLETQVDGIQKTVSASLTDRYTGSQANSDFSLVEQRLQRLEDWSQNLSERLRVLEQELRVR